MLRRAVVVFLRFLLWVFFRRVEVVGAERVPAEPEPVVFCLNHPSALIDPLFVLTKIPRRATFLAKAPLFRMFFVRHFVKALECLPVYRAQDEGQDPRKNEETFAAARALLRAGSTLAMFPEGVSHDQPTLLPLKTGAARIALGAKAGLPSLSIVPVGLFYSEKQTFRSLALVIFGEKIPVESPPEDADELRKAVRALNERIEAGMRAVTVNADSAEAHALALAAERVLRPEGLRDVEVPLTEAFSRRRALLQGARQVAPAELARLAEDIRRHEALLEAAGDREAARVSLAGPLRALSIAVPRLVGLAVLLPLGAIGTALHYLPYRLVGVLAARQAKHEMDVLATAKMVAALILFPSTWAIVAGLAAWLAGLGTALLVLAALPLLGYVAVRLGESLDAVRAALLALRLCFLRQGFLAELAAERARLHEALERLGRDGGGGTAAQPGAAPADEPARAAAAPPVAP